jgi:pimeloyl-ACP methyl ester carboxylesterase
MNIRKHGLQPFPVAVIHGGPGAGGEMAPIARRLAAGRGVLEPIQTAISLEGQVEELKTILEKHGNIPVTLIGFSWGAWLSFIVAARYPRMIKKLILVGSGPFEKKYAASLHQTRLSRLDKEEKAEFEFIIEALGNAAIGGKDRLLARLRVLASKTDAFDPIKDKRGKSDLAGSRGDIFQGVWRDAAEMRKSGRLLGLGKLIKCPVVAIHGDYDPHPAEGVERPLSAVLKDFRFILLKNCGHRPWIERQASDVFYDILENELADTRLLHLKR